MASLWASSMVETFYFKTVSGTDERGDFTYGAATSGTCRFELRKRKVINRDGEEVVASGTLYTESAVAETDLVWVPGDSAADVGLSRKVLAVETKRRLGSTEVDHYAVYL